ncbi:RDD family protein [Cognatilysobacter bugurensis]|uniref:RDD family protein n=1 Tax=Cognatilysobacter bugurensis TaxID=543356 RepID=A0A918W9M6_9GAMM|nr:RDD family protein [Lysobacter bugurensis]GHA85427.1 RDD family protein [Lysobacter bugurensis]
MAAHPVTEPSRPHLGWRLLALFYDLWPAAAMWMAVAALFLVAEGNRPLVPWSPMQWLLWITCWGLTGMYAVASWRRGGQTLGMRPWRLRVIGTDGHAAPRPLLWVRYAVGTLSLLAGGLGFWWAWIDRDRLTWHDRASGTRLVREAKRD